jgi:hypothetical protein
MGHDLETQGNWDMVDTDKSNVLLRRERGNNAGLEYKRDVNKANQWRKPST